MKATIHNNKEKREFSKYFAEEFVKQAQNPYIRTGIVQNPHKTPFALVPWDIDFLEQIELLTQAFCENASVNSDINIQADSETSQGTKKSALRPTLSNKQNIILVFPHSRPKRYIENRYKKLAKETGKAHILPHIMSGNDFQRECLLHFERGRTPYIELSNLDRIAYLHEAVIRVAKSLPEGDVLRRLLETEADKLHKKAQNNADKNYNIVDNVGNTTKQRKKNADSSSKESFAHQNIKNTKDINENTQKTLSLAKFFPWANSLDTLFEECFTHLIEVIDIPHANDEVTPFAAALLAELQSIHMEYISLLKNGLKSNAHNCSSSTQKAVDHTSCCHADKIKSHEKSVYRASTPAFSAYRTAQFIKAYEQFHNNFSEIGNDLTEENCIEKKLQHSPDLGLSQLSKEERTEFFNDFIPDIFKNKVIIFAGFVHLTKVESVLFHFFWEQGAYVVLHSDPNLCTDTCFFPEFHKSTHHYSCASHYNWIRDWEASCMLIAAPKKLHQDKTYQANAQHGKASYDKSSYGKSSYDKSLYSDIRNEQNIHFFSAYDTHSQIEALQKDLHSLYLSSPQFSTNTLNETLPHKNESKISHVNFDNKNLHDDDIALILPNPSSLMPLLHELPDKEVNISMGYPLSRTLFGQFIELLISLQENKINEEGSSVENSYIWRDILSLIRHPYTHMIAPTTLLETEQENNVDIQNVAENEFTNQTHINNNHLEKTSRIIQSKSPEESPEESPEKSPEKSPEESENEEAQSLWRSVLYYLETCLRKSSYSVSLKDFFIQVLGNLDDDLDLNSAHTSSGNVFGNFFGTVKRDFELTLELDHFIHTFFQSTVYNFENMQSLQDVVYALEECVAFFLQFGAKIWQRFPLETQSVTICVERILPKLRDNALSQEYLPQKALFTVLRDMLSSERIPFEADPLQGMQIIGMLESRLLHFKNVFILDMTEENLPGKNMQDPLMPDSLRSLLPLPDARTRENIIAHTFYRLIAGADNVWLYWQEGVHNSAVQSAKNLRSRFVEQCIWEQEKKAKALLHENKNILRTADCMPNAPKRPRKKHIKVTPQLSQYIQNFLLKPLSSSTLNTYIQCPARFFYSHILRLREVEEVSEGNASHLFGDWLHKFLYKTYENTNEDGIFEHTEANFTAMIDSFIDELQSTDISAFASPESFFMLKNAGKYHLENYWKSMPYAIKPIAREKTYTCIFPLTFEGTELHIPLVGICDRVEIRTISNIAPQGEENAQVKEVLNLQDFDDTKNPHYIIDFKTGGKEDLNPKIWEDLDFWQELENALAENARINKNQENHENHEDHEEGFAQLSDNLLKQIAKRIPDIQLPFYLYLYTQNLQDENAHVACNAAWFFLKEPEPEVYLVDIEKYKLKKSHDIDPWDLLEEIKTKRMPTLLTFALQHLLQAKYIKPCEGPTCAYCIHKNYC